MKFPGRILAVVLLTIAAAYVAYSAYSYTGLYRFAAETQIQHFGAYDEIKTFVILMFLVFAVIGGPFAVLEWYMERETEAAPPQPTAGVNNLRLPAISLAVVGPVALLAAGALYWLGSQQAPAPRVVADIDLAKAPGNLPTSGHARVVGMAQLDQVATLATETSNHTAVDHYIPIVPPGWRQGQPVTYFMRTNAGFLQRAENGQFVPISPDTPPFRMETGEVVLRSDALPGPITEFYRKRGVALAATTVLLDPNTSAIELSYSGMALGAGLFGFTLLVTAGLVALVVRSRARRGMA